MANLVTVLPFTVNASNLPVIPANDIKRLSNLEGGSYDHWVFNAGTSAALTGKLNGKVLTAQSTAPTYSSDWLSISLNQGAGLLTDLGEVSGQADTIAMVCNLPTLPTAATVLLGSLGPSSEPASGGGGSVFISSGGKLYLTNKGTAQSSTDTSDTLTADTWAFICISRSMSSGVVRFLKGGSAVREYTGLTGYVPASNSRKLALGSAYYNSQAGNSLAIFEAVVFNRGLTAAEMQALYLRAQARAAAAGITI